MSHTQLSRWLYPQHKGLLTFSLDNDNGYIIKCTKRTSFCLWIFSSRPDTAVERLLTPKRPAAPRISVSQVTSYAPTEALKRNNGVNLR